MQKSLNYGYYIIFTVSEVRRRGHDPALQWRMEFGTINYNLTFFLPVSREQEGKQRRKRIIRFLPEIR